MSSRDFEGELKAPAVQEEAKLWRKLAGLRRCKNVYLRRRAICFRLHRTYCLETFQIAELLGIGESTIRQHIGDFFRFICLRRESCVFKPYFNADFHAEGPIPTPEPKDLKKKSRRKKCKVKRRGGCPNCGSTNVEYSILAGLLVCHNCYAAFKPETGKANEGPRERTRKRGELSRKISAR